MPLKKTLKYYSITLLTLLISGFMTAYVWSIIRSDNHILLLGIIATLITVVAIAFINLIYFVPNISLKYKFIIPGALTILLIFISYRSNIAEMLIFQFFGVINSILGVIWTRKVGRN